MKICKITDSKYAHSLAAIHMQTFTGFFLTFLGKGFLRQLYKGFIQHSQSDVWGAFTQEGELVGFLASSEDLSGFYKYLLRKGFFSFAWYSFLAVLKKPKVIGRLLKAFTYAEASVRSEPYVQISSIGVLPEHANEGIGTQLIQAMMEDVDPSRYAYIKLDTDKLHNEKANQFYLKNGFVLGDSYATREGRLMNEYRYYLKHVPESQYSSASGVPVTTMQ